MRKNTKWIIITGGVISGLGKGITTASIGRLLSKHKVIPVKCDGYLNVDPGTMNPFEHGEVFVLDDGGEVDMDFGHYERFLGINCKSEWSLTTGKMYNVLIKKERRGEFLGKTVQVIPHLTDEIKRNWFEIAEKEKADFMAIEIGGTVGDIENSWFIEAARQLKKDVGRENIMYVHLTYVPYVKSVGQQKTKTAQRDVENLRAIGIVPDIVIGRSEVDLTEESRKKMALFCDVPEEAVISERNIESIYEVPLLLEEEGIMKLLSEHFGISDKTDLREWKKLVDSAKTSSRVVNIALIGKYTELTDAYASLIEALNHAGAHLKCKVKVHMIESTDIEKGSKPLEDYFKDKDAIIVPIGFGSRGAEGKIAAIKYAREHNVPYLGLCFGMQLAVIEFARNVCNLTDANSTEINPRTTNPLIVYLPEQHGVTEKGATMRLGAVKSELKKGTLTAQLYGTLKVEERHRHRYEVNPTYHKVLEDHGLVISGSSREGELVEFIEYPKHPYFVATQAHPEYKSRLEHSSPLFLGLIKAAVEKRYGKQQ